ncbi:MAG TPA: hypothetical protein DDY13_07960 [Cytophagales bacterium]|nr:hypothetical protein [Cytophagales bacterium]
MIFQAIQLIESRVQKHGLLRRSAYLYIVRWRKGPALAKITGVEDIYFFNLLTLNFLNYSIDFLSFSDTI